MSRRDDRDRSRTRRRRDRSPSSQPRKARRREHNDNLVSDGMDWNNLVSWQHNSGYNTSSAFPLPPGNYQSNPSSTQQFHHSPVNYMMPFPPEPTPAKFMTPVMPPPVTSSQATPSPGYPAALPVRPQKAWLTPPDDWKPGDGMFFLLRLILQNRGYIPPFFEVLHYYHSYHHHYHHHHHYDDHHYYNHCRAFLHHGRKNGAWSTTLTCTCPVTAQLPQPWTP